MTRPKRPNHTRSIRVARVSKREVEQARKSLETLPRQLPMVRAECEMGPRPCPYVSCRHHLYADVSPTTGTIKLNWPNLEPHELTLSCSLDVADAGGLRLEDVGNILNVTRERARQLEIAALEKLESADELAEWLEVGT